MNIMRVQAVTGERISAGPGSKRKWNRGSRIARSSKKGAQLFFFKKIDSISYPFINFFWPHGQIITQEKD